MKMDLADIAVILDRYFVSLKGLTAPNLYLL